MGFFVESELATNVGQLDIKINESTDFDMLALEAAIEIEQIDNALMEGIGRFELSKLYEGGEVVYTEGMLDSIKDKVSKIWEFLKKWVKSVWHKFVAWISSFVRGDKEFIAKYKKEIEDNVIHLDKDFEIKSKYNHTKVLEGDLAAVIEKRKNECVSQITNTGEAIRTKQQDNYEDIIETLKDDIEKDYEDFVDEYEDSSDITASWIKTNIQKVMDIVKEDVSKYQKSADSDLKAINKLEKTFADRYKDILKDPTNSQQFKNDIKVKINSQRQIVKETAGAFTKYTTFTIKMVKYRKSLSRAICRKVLTAKPNPKYNESSVFDTNDFESFFKI